MKKHHNDYLNTFSTFMDSIRKELTQKLEEMEKQAEEKKKANDIRLIKCERDFFRLEAVRSIVHEEPPTTSARGSRECEDGSTH